MLRHHSGFSLRSWGSCWACDSFDPWWWQKCLSYRWGHLWVIPKIFKVDIWWDRSQVQKELAKLYALFSPAKGGLPFAWHWIFNCARLWEFRFRQALQIRRLIWTFCFACALSIDRSLILASRFVWVWYKQIWALRFVQAQYLEILTQKLAFESHI